MNEIENRAWFFNEDSKFPVRVYVMFDHKKNRVDYIHLKRGNKIEIEPGEVLKFYVEKTKKATRDFLLSWDFLPNSIGLMLVNKKAKHIVLEVAGEDCQMIPALIIMYDGTVIDNYSIVNITTRKKLLNEEKSVLLPEEEREIWQQYKVSYYNKDCLGDSNLARADHTVVFLCSEKFRQAVLNAGLRGLEFNNSYAGEDFILDD